MFNYVWPIALVVCSNVVYQICAKSLPEGMDPFAHGNLIQEYSKLNWAPFAFGIVLVALEAGWIYAYKAGWPVSTASIVHSAFLAVALIFVGRFLYHEALTWNKLAGVAICLVGLVFINHE